MGIWKSKFSQECNLPLLCTNAKLATKAKDMTFDEKIRFFSKRFVNLGKKDKFLRKYFGICNYNYKNDITKLIPSSTIDLLFIFKNNRFIDVFSIEEQKIVHTIYGDEIIRDMVVSDKKNLVYYITANKLIKWNYHNNTIEDISYYHFGVNKSMSTSPNGDYVAVGKCNGEIILINCSNFDSYVVLENHTSSVKEIVFTHDSNFFISAGGDLDCKFDCSIRVWNVEKQSLLAVLAGHPLSVYSIKIHDNGKFLLSLSRDCTVRLWDLDKIIYNNWENECQGTYLSANHKHFDYFSKTHIEIMTVLKDFPDIISFNKTLKQESFMNYVSSVLNHKKEDTEISRVTLDNDLFYEQNGPIPADAFFIRDFIVLFSTLDMELKFFNMSTMIIQRKMMLFDRPYTKINVVHEKIVFADKNADVHVYDCIGQENKVVVFPGKNLELANMENYHSKLLISCYLDLTTSVYALTIWDLKNLVFHGLFEIGPSLPDFLRVSENAEILFFHTFRDTVQVIDINTKTVLMSFSMENQLLQSCGISDDCKYIVTESVTYKANNINVWGVRDTKRKLHFIKPEFEKKFVMKINNEIYAVENDNKALKVVSDENLNEKSKKYWNYSKKHMYGVYAYGYEYRVFKLNKKDMVIYYNLIKNN